MNNDRKFATLLARAFKGDALDLTFDDVDVFVALETLRDDLANGVELNEHDRQLLIAVIDQFVLPASRRGRHSPIGPKQYVHWLADIAKGDYREHEGRERVPAEIKYQIFKRAIELMEGKFPQWRGQVILEPGMPGNDDIRRYNWQPSPAMEIAGAINFPDAGKLMRRAWEQSARVLR